MKISLSLARSSVRFRLKPDNSNSHEFELHRPSNKGTKLLLKVIKAIIIISLRDGLVIDVFFVCEFKGSSCAPGGWNNGVCHSNDVLQARAKIKNNKYKDVYGLVVTRRLHLPS